MAGGRATGVVGLGAGGIAVLAELVAGAAPQAEFVVFNPAASLARGVPYAHAAAGGLLLNRPVTTMDLAIGPTGAFAAWASRNGYAPADVPPSAGRDVRDDLFLERHVFGHYLLDELAAVLARAGRAGVVVTIVTDTVTDVQRDGDGGYVVRTAGGAQTRVAQLVLATGHRPPADMYELGGHPRHLPQPGPPHAIDPAADIVVLGTRLSGVETALALLRDGHRGRVTLASRGGRLPAVRGRNGAWTPAAFTADVVTARARMEEGDGLTLHAVCRLLGAELRRAGARVEDIGLTPTASPVAQLREDVAAASGAIAWQEVLAVSNVAVSTAWHHLDGAERLRFLARHHSPWLSRRVPIPAQVGAELLAALEGGALHVAGGVRRVAPEGDSAFAIDLAGGRVLSAGWVVSATGSDPRLHAGEPGLVGALLRRRLVVAHPLGGVCVDFATCQVLDPEGRPAERIHALGALTQGNYYMTSAVDVIALQARRVAAALRRSGRFTREAVDDDHGVGAVQGRAAEPT